MASSAVVGALRIDLIMNAAGFDDTVSKAEAKLGKLAKAASIAGTVIGTSIAAAVTAIGVSISKALADFDQFAKLSQSIGMPVEQLSGLAHAADLSGVSLEGLGVALKKLSVNMQEIASGDLTSTAARSFTALGIAVTDAAGAMRPAGDVLLDVAAKFQGMQDGASKTALAVAIFGKAGADLIPLLNSGRDGIKEMTDEAAQLGLVFDGKAASAAERFNDGMSKLASVFTGIGRQIMVELGPAFAMLVEKFVEFVKESGLVKSVAEGVAAVFKTMASAVLVVKAAYDELTSSLAQAARLLAVVAMLQSGNASGAWEVLKNGIASVGEASKATRDTIASLWSEVAGDPALAAAATHRDKIAAPIIQSTQSMAAAQKALNDELREHQRLINEGVKLAEATRSPQEILAEKAVALDAALAANKISAEQFGAAMQKASFVSINAYAGMASGIANNLATAFGNSKAFAIAAAIINTAESVTKTLATYGATPWGIAAAAAAAAAGAAQIATIRKTTKGGGGGGDNGGGGIAAATNTGGGAGAIPQLLTVRGINPSDMYSGGQMRDFANAIIAYQQDGGEVLIK